MGPRNRIVSDGNRLARSLRWSPSPSSGPAISHPTGAGKSARASITSPIRLFESSLDSTNKRPDSPCAAALTRNDSSGSEFGITRTFDLPVPSNCRKLSASSSVTAMIRDARRSRRRPTVTSNASLAPRLTRLGSVDLPRTPPCAVRTKGVPRQSTQHLRRSGRENP